MSRTNAKQEFLNHTFSIGKQVRCASIQYGCEYDDAVPRKYLLNVNYSSNDLDFFLTTLDFCYDSGYGGQELYGTIWYTDGTWSERGEYDGSEWWAYCEVPEIPDELK
jgi:hypothetical protein